ncbi:MAG: hypothetical protein IKN18_04260 [Neisseriaceae bacterium]|nr:hypothetical protein [Neisseriaceae bacterium]
MKSKILMSVMLMMCTAAYAEVYSCGPGCYTSSPSKGHGKANLGNKIGRYTAVVPRTSVSSTATAAAPSKKTNTAHATLPTRKAGPVQTAYTAPAPVAPKFNPTQTNSRRAILEQELNNERNALAQAQKNLADGRVSRDVNQIRRLENAVLDRQQNIQALQRELGRM